MGDRIGALRDRVGTRWLLAGGAVLVAAVVAVFLVAGSGDEPNEVTASEFDQVQIGMGRESVDELLGEPEGEGPHKFNVTEQTSSPVIPGSSVAPIPSTTQSTVTEADCWFYPPGGETSGQVQIGPGESVQLDFALDGQSTGADESNGAEDVVICFDEAQEVSVVSGPFGASLEE